MSSVKGAFMLEIGCSSAKLENGILQREKKYMIAQMWLWVDSHLLEPWAHGQQTNNPFSVIHEEDTYIIILLWLVL